MSHEHHAHNDCCEKQNDDHEVHFLILRLSASVLIFAAAMIFPMPQWLFIALSACAWLVAGYDIALEAFRALFSGRAMDEEFLMTLSSAGAFILGEYAECMAVMLLFQIGELLEEKAVEKSRNAIGSLAELRPDKTLVDRGELIECKAEDVQTGEIILVRPGDRIPLDGDVVDGESSVNFSLLTGESRPVKIYPSSHVMAGGVNLTGSVRIRVSNTSQDSAIERILDLTERAAEHKSRTDAFITRFSKIYTPAVVILAVLIVLIPGFITGDFSYWTYKALGFLAVSCPCALVISVPLTSFAGMGRASGNGILIKGANTLEAFAHVTSAAFDKTGTLTKGVFEVTKILSNGMDNDELLFWAAVAEAESTHPIAEAIRKACPKADGIHPQSVTAYSGRGVGVSFNGHAVYAGNRKLMNENGIMTPDISVDDTLVFIAVDGQYSGCIVISDVIKDESRAAIQALRQSGIENTYILSGDSEAVVRNAAKAVGIDNCYFELLPEDKMRVLEKIMSSHGKNEKLLYFGDGINDAPVLARADIGTAMGGLGADAAMEAADAIIMDDDLSKAVKAIGIAKKTLRIIKQNILLALIFKFAVMITIIFAATPLWLAVFSDVGVCLICVFNAVRALK